MGHSPVTAKRKDSSCPMAHALRSSPISAPLESFMLFGRGRTSFFLGPINQICSNQSKSGTNTRKRPTSPTHRRVHPAPLHTLPFDRLHPSTHSTSAKSSERPSAPRISCNMMHRLQPSVIRHRIALSSSSSLLPTLLVGPRPMLHTRHQANRAAPDLKGDAATSADNGGVPEEGQGAPPPSESRTASPSEAAAAAAASAVAGAEDYFGAQVRPYGPAGNPDAVHAAWHWVTGAGTHASRHAQQ